MNVDLDKWIKKEKTTQSFINSYPADAMSATLGLSKKYIEGDEIPLCWHWLYFLELINKNNIAEDGHEKKGDFLPPVPLDRRMYAGSDISFYEPIFIGSILYRHSKIEAINSKQGSSGPLVFVKVKHTIYRMDKGNLKKIILEDIQNIVYTNNKYKKTKPINSNKFINKSFLTKAFVADSVMLFRYSALTFNSHKIHYDYEYANKVENYPSLVVHGPFMATILAMWAKEINSRKKIEKFSFKIINPVFEGEKIFLETYHDINSREGSTDFGIRGSDNKTILISKVQYK